MSNFMKWPHHGLGLFRLPDISPGHSSAPIGGRGSACVAEYLCRMAGPLLLLLLPVVSARAASCCSDVKRRRALGGARWRRTGWRRGPGDSCRSCCHAGRVASPQRPANRKNAMLSFFIAHLQSACNQISISKTQYMEIGHQSTFSNKGLT